MSDPAGRLAHVPDAASVLDRFSPATSAWFRGAFDAATPAQLGAWEALLDGDDALVVAPTGSGKTLAAFLASLDRLAAEPVPDDPRRRLRVLYVSPLKALAVDVERNLRAPLTGIRHAAVRLGLPEPDVRVGVRSGDTPAEERRTFARRPPDVLITTPESLFLLLTSAAREALRAVDTVIVDEVHAVAATKRGAHLALSLERLDALLDRPATRVGLSATVRPVQEVARFLGGSTREVRVVQPPSAKRIVLDVVVPVEDMSELGTEQPGPSEAGGSAAGAAQRTSIWPHIESRVLDLVETHRSTIVFCNSRRTAERLTARLNELATERAHPAPQEPAPPRGPSVVGFPTRDLALPADGPAPDGGDEPPTVEVARAHHGSVSKEQRAQVEELLKTGRLPCVVATSSLELGIDMGAVDLVVQVESPPSVASGLQRVGRAGHQVGADSHGVMFPKFRGDLLPAAVTAERMRDGQIESMRYPRNPLDVLAQQVVAHLALEPTTVDELAALVRRAAPFASLPASSLEATLDMLAGRYPSDAFAELRPRLVWDRVTGELSARPGAQRLAVTSGGTIPDRGLFGVFLVGEKASRVGELDEEMVYESRVGDVLLLGSSSWRIEDITHDRVLVSPAPGQPGRLPFWHGDAPGRPLELGRALGAFVRELGRLEPDAAGERCAQAGLDENATANLLALLAEQRQATGVVPDDRTLVVERFRDELGDWRLAVHSPFGSQVNAPWALALAARLRERYGVEVQMLHTDDGVVLRLPETEDSPEPGLAVLEPDDVEPLVRDEVGGSSLFASRFRECAGRALLLPRRDPGRRSPLWQQRQRSAQLLGVASQFGSFPIVLETVRECLQDVYDVPGLVELMRDVASRRVRVVDVETSQPSPFARSLLFGYVGTFMYEGDSPLAERRAAALSLDTGLLAELLGQAELRDLLDPDALAQVEAELQRLAPDRQVRDVEGTADLLRVVGDVTTAEARERGVQPGWLVELESARRALRVRVAGEERWVAVEDAGRLQDALGVPLPVGVPEAFLAPVPDPLGDLVARYARTHGPFSARDVAARLGLGVAVVDGALGRLAGSGRVVAGEFRPGGSGTEHCDAEVLRRLRRRSLATLRAEVEPVPAETLGRFLPAWQGLSSGPRRVHDAVDATGRAVDQLAGARVTASALERLVLPARVAGYSGQALDELTASGEVLWCGSGSLPGDDGWVALAPADTADLLLPLPDEDAVSSPLHRAVLEALGGGAALFFRGLQSAVHPEVGLVDDDTLTTALWELVWGGWVTNDTLAPLRARLGGGARGAHRSGGRRPPRAVSRRRTPLVRGGRPAMPSRTGPPSTVGRWSALPEREPDATRRLAAQAEVLLERHGVLVRGSLAAEDVTGGFAAVYQVLSRLEDAGRVRRGYFVEGLGGAQFASPGAVDRLRALAAELRDAQDAGRQGLGDGVPAGVDAVTGEVLTADPWALPPDGAAGLPAAPLSASDPWAVPVPGGWTEQEDRARRRREARRTAVLAATDPANPYGAALPWPSRETDDTPDAGTGHVSAETSSRTSAPSAARRRGHQPGRKAGALVVVVDGRLVLYVERGGRTLLSFSDDPACLPPAADALALAVREGALGTLSVERADGEPALTSPLGSALEAAGFRPTPRGLRLRA